MDFVKIVERSKRDEIEIFPDFQTGDVKDILGRGKCFYAIWDEEAGLWSTKENDVQRLVDKELWDYVNEFKRDRHYGGKISVKTLKSNSSGMWNAFTQYMRRFPDSGVLLDNKLIFADTVVKKSDYASKRLPYKIEKGSYDAWDQLVGTLYSPPEREKIEWSIGAVLSGDSKKIQKFFVFYGAPGKGKGTIIAIIKKLFDGYYVTFDAKALGMSSDQFSMEVFKSNPLVAIDVDGNLSRIEDNTRLNSIVSHEELVVNEKGKTRYSMAMNCFLYIASNNPVKITDGKSGILRRLIDINPSGMEFKPREYEKLTNQIDFELGAIAYRCLEVYRTLGKNYYKNYIPQQMVMKTDVFYNFVEANLDIFEAQEEGISLKQAYAMYKEYCDESFMEYKLPMYKFREELKNYYENFDQLARIDGKQVRSWFSGFLKEKMEAPVLKKEEKPLPLVLDSTKSLLDDILADCPAQYAKEDGSPEYAWDRVTTKLKDLDTSKVHYVLTQKYDPAMVEIDFDLKNNKGEKDMMKNLEAASKWPSTYAEFSKGGCGIHLTYIYDGDVSKLNPVYVDGIEVKAFRGKAALRRRVSKCNDIPIAHLAEGSLPLKEEKVIDVSVLKDELHLRNIIKKCLRKENHGATRPEVDLIAKVLDEAYTSGMSYDVSDLGHDILVFAMNSTNQSEYCVSRVNRLRLESKDVEAAKESIEDLKRGNKQPNDGDPIVFFDIEIYPPGKEEDGRDNPGLFLVCWKEQGENKTVHSMINPKPYEIEDLLKFKLMGYNNRSYDNHILAGALRGYTNAQLYDLSRRIIVDKAKEAFFPEAYRYSYGDVRDIISNKQSLKIHEIDLGISHIEMGIPWDKPAPMDMWEKIVEYCSNDVVATEAVFNAYKGDFVAREILADLAGGCVNDTTNQLTTRIIFGKERHPRLVYTDFATGESR